MINVRNGLFYAHQNIPRTSMQMARFINLMIDEKGKRKDTVGLAKEIRKGFKTKAFNVHTGTFHIVKAVRSPEGKYILQF